LRFWAILGDLRKNWDFQALRFKAISGDFKEIEIYILLRFPPTGQNWQDGLG
jgi:hypothetical protein